MEEGNCGLGNKKIEEGNNKIVEEVEGNKK